MAGPALSTSVTAATTGHPAASNAVHAIVNEFDTTISSALTGDILRSNGTVFIHAVPLTPVAIYDSGTDTWPNRPYGAPTVGLMWISTHDSAAAEPVINDGSSTAAHNGDMWFRHPNPV